MYCLRKIGERRKKACERLGFDVQPHSKADVEAAKLHLASIWDGEEGRFTRPLGDKEIRWIRNERAMSMCSFEYWLTRYAIIRNWAGKLAVFQPNIAQRMTIQMWGETEDQDRAICMIQLKARQLGFSTLCEAAVAHRVQFYANTNAVIASADPDKSDKMSKMIDLFYDQQPPWMLGQLRRVGKEIEFPAIKSVCAIQHGSQFNGISRGTTPNVAHLCLAPNTLIRIADGRLMPVDEIHSGDTVINSHGALVLVKKAWKSPRRNEMTAEIAVWGTPTAISCTRDHLILTGRGWVKAAEVESSDWVHYPVRPIDDSAQSISITSYRKGQHVGTKSPTQVALHEPTFALGRLAGLYLAEGCIHRSVERKSKLQNPLFLSYSVHADEDERTRKWISEAFPENQNWRVSNIRKNSKSCVVPFAHKGFAIYLAELFGEKDSKRLSDSCWRHGRDFAEGVVFGYLSGDGHFCPRTNEIYASSIRPAILFGLRELIASLGYGWSQIVYRRGGPWYGRNCKDIWTLVIDGSTARTYREKHRLTVFDAKTSAPHHWKSSPDGHLLLEVSSNTEGLSESFYDLEVDCASHSFTTACGTVHNSELADFLDPEELVDASLLRAMHETPETFLMLESTAAGRHNWWHRTYEFSVANYPLGRSRLQPSFLPWFVGTDLYPSDSWLRARPVPQDWRPFDSTIAHADRAEAYVKNNPLLIKQLGKGWTMPDRQKWFYEVERAEHVAKKELNHFLGEMPADALEAFQSTNVSAFDHDTVDAYRSHAREPLAIYGIIGRAGEIPLKIQPSQRLIDPNEPRVKVRAAWSESQKPIDFELVPLVKNGYPSAMDFSNKLFVWEKPEEGAQYGLGVDTGDGVGLDRSVIEVVRKGTLHRNEKQCAEWASAYVNAYDLWPIAMAIGTYFATKFDGRLVQPKMVIETNRNGEAVQKELLKRGWKKFHQWVRYDRKKTNEAKSEILGWRTVSWSRSLVMDCLLKYLKDGWIDVDSPWFIDEMSDLERDESRQSLKAAHGGNDDRIMALGIVLFSMTVSEVRGRDRGVAVERANQREQGFSYPKYDPGFQGRDFGLGGAADLPVHQFLRDYEDSI